MSQAKKKNSKRIIRKKKATFDLMALKVLLFKTSL